MRDHHWHFIIVLKGTFHTKLKKYKIDHRPLPLDLNIKQNKREPVTQLVEWEREISKFSGKEIIKQTQFLRFPKTETHKIDKNF